MPIFKGQEDSKADVFRGITIFVWVMVVLLALTFVLSFDKLCSRSSPWTLTVSHGTFCDTAVFSCVESNHGITLLKQQNPPDTAPLNCKNKHYK